MSYTPPERVASAARRGLRLREKVKAGTPVGIARARDLSNRRPVSLETIGRMVSFFARHGAQRPADVGTDAEPTPWLVAWLLWGGDAGRDWAEGIWERERMTREWTVVRWESEAVGVRNPKGLHVGRPFRTLTAGEPVRSGTTGELLGQLSSVDLVEMVRVFESRIAADEGAPRIDYNHGPSSGGRPEVYGEVLALYVAEDERGAGLYVVPGWTDYGREFVAQHATPTGDSLLSNSPEFRLGDAFSRGGEGERLGGAELYGVALTPTPQQSESIIDTVRLSTTTAEQATGGGPMDPETPQADERLAALEAGHAELAAKLDRIAEAVASLVEAEKADEGEAEPDALAADEPAELDDQMGKLLSALSEMDDDEKKRAMEKLYAMNAKRDAAALAWARKQADARVSALEAQVAAERAARLDERCAADVGRLIERGLPAARRDFAAAAWRLHHGEGRKAWAAKETPWDSLVSEVERGVPGKVVPLGVAGARGLAAPADEADVIKAWAAERGLDFDARPVEVTRRYNIESKKGVSR